MKNLLILLTSFILQAYLSHAGVRDLFLTNKTDINPPSLDEVIDSGYYKAILKKNSPVFDFKQRKYYKVEKEIYVNVFKKTDHHGFMYILNKDLKLKYIVQPKYIYKVTQVTDLDPKPDQFLTFQRVPVTELKDTYVFNTRFQVGYLYNSPVFIRKYTKNDTLKFQNGYRISFSELIDLKTEHQLGLGLDYQISSYSGEAPTEAQFTGLDLNLIFSTDINPSYSKGFRYLFLLSWGLANKLSYTDSNTKDEYEFNSQGITVQYEYFKKLKKYIYTIGGSIQRRSLIPKEKFPQVDNFPQKINQDIYSLYISWGYHQLW